MTTLLFLDDYHVGDPLFLTDLGRRLSKLAPGSRTMILHRVGEAVANALESAEAGDHETVLVERTIRETNQGITRRLTEEGVPAVSIQGSDHGLLTFSDSASGASLRADGAAWLHRTVSLGAIPIISPVARLSRESNRSRTADPVACAVALANRIKGEGQEEVHAAVFCSSRKGGLFREKVMLESVSSRELAPFGDVIDVEAAAALASVADRLVATNSVSLAKGPVIPGTIITS